MMECDEYGVEEEVEKLLPRKYFIIVFDSS